MECDVGILHAVGNQPEVATSAGGLGNVQGGTDVPFCAGRLLFSGEQRISALSLLLTRSREQCRVLLNTLRGWDSAWPSCLFRLGDGASGANFVVSSHALKKSENSENTTHAHTKPTAHIHTEKKRARRPHLKIRLWLVPLWLQHVLLSDPHLLW